jgi:hypothetical protein
MSGKIFGICQHSECRRIYIVDRTVMGRPNEKYCCKEHRIAHHNANATQRQRNSRAKRKDANYEAMRGYAP